MTAEAAARSPASDARRNSGVISTRSSLFVVMMPGLSGIRGMRADYGASQGRGAARRRTGERTTACGPVRTQVLRCMPVRRLFTLVAVLLLSLSASGAAAVVLDEPCIGAEQTTREDGACPPTCVTCGCCAQAAEPLLMHVVVSETTAVTRFLSAIPQLPSTPARDILHVPRPDLSR